MKKMKKKHKRMPSPSVVVVVLVVLSILIVLYTYSRRAAMTNLPAPSPTVFSIKQLQEGEFGLVDIKPKPPVFKSVWSTEAIVFTFSEDINPDSIDFQVLPNPDVSLITNNMPKNSFSLVPFQGWSAGTNYQIKISKSLSSKSEKTLSEDIVFTISRQEPSEGDIEYPVPPSEPH